MDRNFARNLRRFQLMGVNPLDPVIGIETDPPATGSQKRVSMVLEEPPSFKVVEAWPGVLSGSGNGAKARIIQP
jgi:hypothetical protein